MSHHPAFNDIIENKYSLLLDEEEYLFIASPETTGYGTWFGTNASLAPEKTFRFREEYNTLRIAPLVEGSPPSALTQLSISHSPKVCPVNLAGDAMVMFAYFYSPCTIFVQLNISDSNGTSASGPTVEVTPNTWTLIRSGEVLIAQQTSTLSFTASVDIETTGGLQHIHMAHPVLTNTDGFAKNIFLREAITFLPRFLVETDSEQTNPQFPMLRMSELGLGYGDRGYRQALAFQYRDISEGFDSNNPATRSGLVDPVVADQRFLPWLAQFVGIKFENVVGGTTPWGNLPTTWDDIHTEIDPDADVTYTIASIDVDGVTLASTPSLINEGDTVSISGTTNYNGQFLVISKSGNDLVLEPAIDEAVETTGTVTLVDTSWQEIEVFNTVDSNFVSTRRQVITQARTGHNAGTTQAIKDAAGSILTGSKWVSVSHDPVASPWVLRIQTLTTETPNGETGSSSLKLVTEVNTVKPMGFVVEHECIDLALLFDEAGLSYDSGAPYDAYVI